MSLSEMFPLPETPIADPEHLDDGPPLILSAREAAPYLRCTERTVTTRMRTGELDAVVIRIGPRKWISAHLLTKYLRGELT